LPKGIVCSVEEMCGESIQQQIERVLGEPHHRYGDLWQRIFEQEIDFADFLTLFCVGVGRATARYLQSGHV
jgi:hypothetical protein